MDDLFFRKSIFFEFSAIEFLKKK